MPPIEIVTTRLRLVPITPELVRAFFNDRDKLSRLLKASIPNDWPVDPVIMEILIKRLDDPSAFEWADYICIHKEDGKVVGDGGFKGPPDTDGCVEIGYGIIPEYRKRGLATEAALALVELAFSHQEVKILCAETVIDGIASIRVLQKLGMHQHGTNHNDEDGDLYCWQLTRDDYEDNVRHH